VKKSRPEFFEQCEKCPESNGEVHLKGVYDSDGNKINTGNSDGFVIGIDKDGNPCTMFYKLEKVDGQIKMVFIEPEKSE
jgi:hypothetical protein